MLNISPLEKNGASPVVKCSRSLHFFLAPRTTVGSNVIGRIFFLFGGGGVPIEFFKSPLHRSSYTIANKKNYGGRVSIDLFSSKSQAHHLIFLVEIGTDLIFSKSQAP